MSGSCWCAYGKRQQIFSGRRFRLTVNKRKVVSEDIWALKFLSDPRFSPDGKKIAYTLTEIDVKQNGYQSAIWVSQDVGCGRRVTYGVKEKGLIRENTARWSPNGKYLSFLSNRDGRNQIFLLPRSGGEAFQLTQHEPGVSNPVWSPDGKYIAFVGKEPQTPETKNEDVMVFTKLRYKFNGAGYITDHRPQQIWVVEVETGHIKPVTDSPYNSTSPAWSPDSNAIAFVSCRCDNETYLFTDIWVQELDGELYKVTDNLGPASAPGWSPDGEYITYLGHAKGVKNSANTDLWVIPKIGGSAINLTSSLDISVGSGVGSDARFGGGNMQPQWKNDNSGLFFVAAERGASSLYFVSTKGEVEKLTAEQHAIVGFDVHSTSQEDTIAFVSGNPLSPGELYLYNEGSFKQITEVNKDVLQKLTLVSPENYVYESKDGLEIEGWIMKPTLWQPDEKYPVVVEIHGGPHAAYGYAFYHEFQLLCAQGYGVVFTNPRGSRTYGEAFTHGVVGDWGGGDFDDIMAAVDYVCDNYDWVDEARIGVTGGSYGGYLTNWIVTQTQRFKAAVTLRSISNMYTKYGVSDIGWYGNRAGMGGADLWDDEEFIMSRSPIRYAPKVRTPLLIIHSLEDYRCPFEQAEQLYVALKRLGNAPVEMVVFKGENHELSRSGKPRNRVERLERILDWFSRYL